MRCSSWASIACRQSPAQGLWVVITDGTITYSRQGLHNHNGGLHTNSTTMLEKPLISMANWDHRLDMLEYISSAVATWNLKWQNWPWKWQRKSVCPVGISCWVFLPQIDHWALHLNTISSCWRILLLSDEDGMYKKKSFYVFIKKIIAACSKKYSENNL